MKAWIARDKPGWYFARQLILLFFGKKPKLGRDGFWVLRTGNEEGRYPIPACRFPKLKHGEIRQIEITVPEDGK